MLQLPKAPAACLQNKRPSESSSSISTVVWTVRFEGMCRVGWDRTRLVLQAEDDRYGKQTEQLQSSDDCRVKSILPDLGKRIWFERWRFC